MRDLTYLPYYVYHQLCKSFHAPQLHYYQNYFIFGFIIHPGSRKGVEIRLIHAKEPGPAFRQDFDKYPALIDGMELVLCPRVHFKIIVFDLKTAYVGSANLTGAGLGMKGENTRNFEAGILSSNRDFVKHAAEQFDSVRIRLRASANVNNFLSCKRA